MRTTKKCKEFTSQIVETKRLGWDNNKSHDCMTIKPRQLGSLSKPIIARFRVDCGRTKPTETNNLLCVSFLYNPLQRLTGNTILNRVRSSNLQPLIKIFICKSTPLRTKTNRWVFGWTNSKDWLIHSNGGEEDWTTKGIPSIPHLKCGDWENWC